MGKKRKNENENPSINFFIFLFYYFLIDFFSIYFFRKERSDPLNPDPIVELASLPTLHNLGSAVSIVIVCGNVKLLLFQLLVSIIVIILLTRPCLLYSPSNSFEDSYHHKVTFSARRLHPSFVRLFNTLNPLLYILLSLCPQFSFIPRKLYRPFRNHPHYRISDLDGVIRWIVPHNLIAQ